MDVPRDNKEVIPMCQFANAVDTKKMMKILENVNPVLVGKLEANPVFLCYL